MNAERRSSQVRTARVEAIPSLGAQVSLEHQAQGPRIFPRSRLAPEVATAPHQSDQIGKNAIRSELLQMSQEDATQEGITVVKNGVYQQRSRSTENASGIGKLWTPIVTETYTINNPDGTQTVYSQPVKKFGVYEEHYSVEGKRSKRTLLDKKLVGETLEFIPERQPDGSVKESEAYKGEIRIYSEEAYKRRYKIENEIDSEPLEKTVERLKVRLIPFPRSQAETLQTIQQLSYIQSGMAFVRANLGEQAKLAGITMAISGASSAFIFLGPGMLIAPGVKQYLDIGAVAEAYTLLRTSDPEELKKKLKPYNIIFDALKTPFLFAGNIIQQAQNNVSMMLERRREVNEYQKDHPYIQNRKMLKRELAIEEFDTAHEQWIKQLKRINPHLSEQTIGQVAQKYIALEDKSQEQLAKDALRVARALNIPNLVYLSTLAVGLGLSPLTAGLSMHVAPIVAPILSGVARPFINWTQLKELKDEIERERPSELIPVQQLIQQMQQR